MDLKGRGMNFGTNRLVRLLLASTSLTSGMAATAAADVLYASSLEGGFSTNAAAPTVIGTNVTSLVNDQGLASSEGGTVTDYFEVTNYDPSQPFTIGLITPDLGVSVVTEGGTYYTPTQSLEGTSFSGTLTPGTVNIRSSSSSASSGSLTLTQISAEGGSGYTYPSAVEPVLSFYNDVEGSYLDSVFVLEGNSFTLEGSDLDSVNNNIYFSVAFDFDYVVNLSDNGNANVPEPGSATLLGAGLAGLAAARRARAKKKSSTHS